jgi:gliding motility-associated-like protein
MGSTNVTITEPTQLTASTSQTNVSCNGGSDGNITLTAGGGTTPYSYNWTSTGYSSSSQNPTGLKAATYSFTITDANGCKKMGTVVITEPSALTIAVSSQSNVSCKGDSNGSVTVIGANGTSPYTYSMKINSGYTSSSVFNNLKATNYTIYVKDANGCVKSISVKINEPTELISSTTQINVSCNGGNDGSINLIASGGKKPYTFSWSGPSAYSSTSQNITGLKAGSYTFIITDSNNCKRNGSATILEPTALSISATTIKNVSCYRDSNGSVTLSGLGGTKPYEYKLGNGNYSSNNTFGNLKAGNYVFWIKDAKGCTSSAAVTINEPTLLTFTYASKNASCLGANDGSVTISAIGGTPNYMYKLGSGTWKTSSVFNNLNKGIYYIYVKDSLGCMKTDSVSIGESVIITPVLDISSASKQCLGNTFVFTGVRSTINAGFFTISWKFGDGNSATGNTVTHAYNTAGIYTVTMTVTGNTGCSETLTTQVTVHANPVVVYCPLDKVNKCEYKQCFRGNNFNFNSTSYISTGSIVKYEWNMGDGTTYTGITLKNVLHTFKKEGTYKTTLLATSDNGCKAIDSVSIEVLEHPVSKLSVSASDTCFNGNYFDFSSNGTLSVKGSSIKTYNWDLGNNSLPATSIVSMPKNITYLVPGIKKVVLVVEDQNSCKDTNSINVIVHPSPNTIFAMDASTPNTTQCLKGNKFLFENKSTVASGTMTYFWDFGDGTTSTNRNPVAKTYNIEGTYLVKLTVTSSYNCQSATSLKVTVNPMPKPDFKTNPICSLSNTVNFVNFTTISSGTVTNYNWDFGDGNTSAVTSPSHVFASSKTYVISLKSTSDKGCEETISKSIVVYDKILARFTVNRATCGVNSSIQFTDISLAPGGATKYSWSFGDGSTSSQKDPLHIYGKTGTFKVKMKITTIDGCSDSAEETIKINEIPKASFKLDSDTICSNNKQATFINTSVLSSGTMNYEWDFGDGFLSTQKDPVHTYGSYGSYTVKLKAISDAGCEHTYSNTIQVRPMPVINFDLTVDQPCLRNNAITLTNKSSIATGTYQHIWSISDGTTSVNTSPYKYSFKNDGQFIIKLTAVSNFGCKDSAEKSIDIYKDPAANFTVNNGVQCTKNNLFEFTDASVVSTAGGISAYEWDFGDSTYDLSNNSKVTKSYSTYGKKFVQLTIKSLVGCTDKKVIPVDVYDMPKADFLPNQFSQCFNEHNYDFSNLTTITSGNGTLSYDWDLDEGKTSTVMSPSSINYGFTGTKNIILTATSSYGCIDAITKQINILPSPDAPIITIHKPINCYGWEGALKAETKGGTPSYQYSWNGGVFGNWKIDSDTFWRTRAGKYHVIVRDTNGCFNNDSFALVQPVKLEISYSIYQDVSCFNGRNGDAEITATGGTTPYAYGWSWMGTGPPNLKSGKRRNDLIAGDWQINVTDFNGCKDSTTLNIKQPNDMLLKLTETTPIKCYGDTATWRVDVIGGAKNYQYFWNFEKVATGPVRTGLKASPLNQYIDVIDANGCQKRLSFIVKQPLKLIASIDSVKPVDCFGQSTGTLIGNSTGGTGIKQYRWYDAIGNTKSIQRSYVGLAAGSYRLIVNDANNCFDTLSNILVRQPNPLHVIVLNNDSATCYKGKNAFVRVSAKGGNGKYKYRWTTSPNILDSVISNVGSGFYKVLVSDSLGCAADSTIKIKETVKNPLNLQFGNVGVCYKDSLKLFADMNNAVRYDWYSDSMKQNFSNVNPLIVPSMNWGMGGKYIVTAIDRNGCRDTNALVVTIKPKPILSGYVDPKVACIGSRINLHASGASNYEWYRYNQPYSRWDMIGLGTPYLINSAVRGDTGIYRFKGLADNGCFNFDSVRVRIGLDEIKLDNDTQFCAGSIVSVGAKGGVTYTWTTPLGTSINGPRLYFNRLNETDEGTYSVNIKDQFGCTGMYDIKLKVLPRPTVTLAGTTPPAVCENSDLLLLANTDAKSMDWYGPNGAIIKNSVNNGFLLTNVSKSDQGTYKCVAYSPYGCMDSSTQLVLVNPLPNAEILYSKRCSELVTDEFIYFRSNAGSLGNKYEWFLDNNPVNDSINYIKWFENAGSYSIKLKVTSGAGCSAEREYPIMLEDAPKIHVPTAFTPNNDRLNSEFKPITLNVVNYKMYIYDRWGGKIFEGVNSAWDGKILGQPAPIGVYAVILDYSTICGDDKTILDKSIKTDVTLIR